MGILEKSNSMGREENIFPKIKIGKWKDSMLKELSII